MTWRQVQTERGPFWVCSEEQERDLAQVVSEQQDRSGHRYWTAAVFGPVGSEPSVFRVQPGDVVLDLGAHLGVFTRIALEAGAARVVAVEPDPLACESLRRTFEAEIAEGRVQVIEVAVSGLVSRMLRMAGTGIRAHLVGPDEEGGECCTATVDMVVARLDLARVDFIKLDIEGSERWALSGAAETVRRDKPNIACCVYHRPDDPAAILSAVRGVRDDYTVTAGPVAPWMTTPVLYFFWR